MCGCLAKAMYGTWQAASALQEEVETTIDARRKHDSPSIVAVCFFDRSGVDGDYGTWEVQTVGPGDDDGKHGSYLKQNPRVDPIK